jgi:hypothetical protein
VSQYAFAYALGLVILVIDAGLVLADYHLFGCMRVGRLALLGELPPQEPERSQTYMDATDWRR